VVDARGRAAQPGGVVADELAEPAEQLDEVLARFEPVLAPWTRCTACNGELRPVAKEQMRERLQSGTMQTYDTFAVCESCGQAYWRGAHSASLDAIVEHATTAREQARAQRSR